jgi:hypothetical protein
MKKEVLMKESMIRLSFDIPVEDHVILKSECAQARIAMKDFLHNLVLKGIQELRQKELRKRLKKSVQQSKEGKVKSRGSFSKYVDDEI